jgi:AraC-like DNA-binding protein
MINRNKPTLADLSTALPTPRNYYRGLRRLTELPPDNVLLFTRNRRSEVHEKIEQMDFHQRWVLIIALSGEGGLIIDRHSLRLKPGTAILVPPLHLHGYEKLPARLKWLYITFEWPGHTALSENWTGVRRLDGKARDWLARLMSHYLLAERSGTIACGLLLELLRQLSTAEATRTAAENSLLKSVQVACAASLPGESLTGIARRMGMSESNLRARFRAETGLSLGKYLRESRLRRAALWLREENISITTAAERAGYPDIFTFSRAFRKVMGAPPSRVRQS